MPNYVFAGSLYDTRADWLAAVCDGYLTAGGANSLASIRQALADYTDQELAAALVRHWSPEDARVDVDHGRPEPYTVQELVPVLAGLRQQYAPPCENQDSDDPSTCEDLYNCCSCGGAECGCPYCWDCHACAPCQSRRE